MLRNYFHYCIHKGKQERRGKQRAHQLHDLLQPSLRALFLLTSFPNPRDDVTSRNVSTVRAACLSPHIIPSKDNARAGPKSFVRPYQQSQQSNSTFPIRKYNHHSWMSSKMNSASVPWPINMALSPGISRTSYQSFNLPNEIWSTINRRI